jgi:hypothetical protein
MISVKRIPLALASLLLLLSSCAKDINNKEAIRAAVVEHLSSVQEKTGLSLNSFDIEVASMSFQKDQATATVSFRPKAGGEGMTMPYAFEKKGDKWVVRSRMESGPGGHGAGQALPPAGGALPPGHPKVGADK